MKRPVQPRQRLDDILHETSAEIRLIPGRIKRALEEREYRPLYHLLAAVVIVAAACFLFYRNFGHPGTLMAPDMTWPDTIARMQFKVLNTWHPYGSYPGPAAPMYFFWTYPTAMLARLLHLSASRYMFAMFLGAFSLAGISMYAMSYRIISRLDIKRAAPYAPYVGAVVAGLIYMYNPWSIHYLRPYFAYPIYALLPLVFLAMVKTFDSPSMRNIILFSIFITVANTTYTMIWLWGLIVSYAVYIVLVTKPRKKALKRSCRVFLWTAFLYFFLNAQWTLPYIGAKIVGKPFTAFYGPEMSRRMLEGLSANSTMVNNFRLLSAWSWSVTRLKGGLLLQAITFAIPIFALLGMIFAYREIRRNREVNYWTVLAVLTILLATGEVFIIGKLYSYFSFDAPGAGMYGWILRCSERWLFFLAPFLALMVGILLSKLLEKAPSVSRGGPPRGVRWNLLHEKPGADSGEKTSRASGEVDRLVEIENSMAVARYRRNTAAAVIIVTIVLTSMFPKTLEWANKVYNPTNVPGDYRAYRQYISGQGGESRVVWLPFGSSALMDYKWAPEKKVNPPYGTIISGPNLGSYYELLNADSYFNWVQDLYLEGRLPDVKLESPEIMLSNNVLSRLLIPFSAKYLVLDQSAEGYDFGDNLRNEKSIRLKHSTKYLKIFETDSNPGYIWAATKTIKANSFYDNLAFNQKLTPRKLANVAFTDGESYFGFKPVVGPRYGAVELNDHLDVVNQNPGFELRANGEGLPGWYWNRKADFSRVSTDSKTKVGGKRSLKVENSSHEQYQIAFVYGAQQQIYPRSIYAIESNIRYRNASWTHISVEGYLAKYRQWVTIMTCPSIQSGNSGWKKYYGSFYVPAGFTDIRLRLGAGWEEDPKRGAAVTWFDDVKLMRVNDKIYSEIDERPQPPDIFYSRKTAEKYTVKVRGAKAPFVLVQSEAHDPLWVVKTSDGKKIDAQPYYGTICGYPIDQTGDFDLTVEYQPQKWCNFGFFVVFFTLFICLAYLLYDWKLRSILKDRGAEIDIGRVKAPAYRLVSKISGPVHRALSRVRSFIDEPPRRRRR